MIIINLKGGLGNQMFQYACGRALSLRSGDPDLKLNTLGLERANEVGDIYRPYSLSHFLIKADIATQEEIRKIANPFRIFSKAWRYFKAKYIYDFYIRFFPSIISKKGDVYLDGYFQSEKYFIDQQEEIREDFKPKEISSKASEWIKRIKDTPNSVSLHVRRGDYVRHKTLGNICTKEYYDTAVAKIKDTIDVPNFFVFSDDVEWVKSNLDLLPPQTQYVSPKELSDDDYEELVIMSSCSHNIIANSSFSWWAAWLNENPNKTVIAPKLWAHGKNNAINFRDIIPLGWTKI